MLDPIQPPYWRPLPALGAFLATGLAHLGIRRVARLSPAARFSVDAALFSLVYLAAFVIDECVHERWREQSEERLRKEWENLGPDGTKGAAFEYPVRAARNADDLFVSLVTMESDEAVPIYWGEMEGKAGTGSMLTGKLKQIPS